jgi:hypothetical protein
MGDAFDKEGHVRPSATSFFAQLAFVGLAAIAISVLVYFGREVDWQRALWYQLITGALLAIAGGAIAAWGIATFLSVDPNQANASAAPGNTPVGGKPTPKPGSSTVNKHENDIAGDGRASPPEADPNKAAPPSRSEMSAAAATLLAGLSAIWSSTGQRHGSDREANS